MERSYGSIRTLAFTGKGNNASLTLPKEISDLLRNAGIRQVEAVLTEEGILLVPYHGRPSVVPKWAEGGHDE
jgi:hypothetical protein